MSNIDARNRRLLMGGATVLGSIAIFFIVLGLITGDRGWFGAALVAAVAGLADIVEIVNQRYRLVVGAGWAALSIAVGQGLIDFRATTILSGLGLVSLGMMLVTFVRRRLRLTAWSAWAIILVGLSLWWLGDDGWTFAMGMVGGYAFLSIVQVELQAAYRRTILGQRRSEELIARASVPILEVDFSGVTQDLRQLYRSRGEDLADFLVSKPNRVEELLSRVIARDMNEEARAELRIQPPDLPMPLHSNVPSEHNLEPLASLFAAIGSGAAEWDGVMVGFDALNTPVWYVIRQIVSANDSNLSSTHITMTNITELKRAQEALEELDASKNEFIATITHEMRTPLAGIVGFSSELAEHLGDYDESVSLEMIGMINRQSREIAYILDDLMIIAAAEMGSLKFNAEMVNVYDLLNDVVNETDVNIKIEGPQPATFAYGDPVRVKQIMRNLLTNVDRYGGPGRRIDVRALPERILVSVIDDGDGLDEVRERQIFASQGPIEASDRTGSMGLGLNVSRTLAGLMRARLSYHRIDDETHFRLDLARMAPTSETEPNSEHV